jgi:hypothetical protein
VNRRVQVMIIARTPRHAALRYALAIILIRWAAALIYSAMPKIEVL